MNKILLGTLSGLAAGSIWGGMYVVSKVVLDVIPPFGLLTLRLILAVGVLGIVAWRVGALRDWIAAQDARAQTIRLLGIGVVGFGLSVGLQFVGTRLSTAANGALITSGTPAFVAVFAFFLLREPLNLRKAAAVLLATLGVVLVIDPRTGSFGGELLWGNLALLGAAVSWGLYSVLVRRAAVQQPVLTITLFAAVGGLALCVPLAIVERYYLPWAAISPGVILGVLYLGFVATALGLYLWNKAFVWLEASAASLTIFAQPVVGALLGAWLLGERPSTGFLWGAVLIFLAVGLATRPLQPAAASSA